MEIAVHRLSAGRMRKQATGLLVTLLLLGACGTTSEEAPTAAFDFQSVRGICLEFVEVADDEFRCVRVGEPSEVSDDLVAAYDSVTMAYDAAATGSDHSRERFAEATKYLDREYPGWRTRPVDDEVVTPFDVKTRPQTVQADEWTSMRLALRALMALF